MYGRNHALDYCGNTADLVASRILVTRRWRLNSHYFGDCRDRGGYPTRHWARGLSSRLQPSAAHRDPPFDWSVSFLKRFLSRISGNPEPNGCRLRRHPTDSRRERSRFRKQCLRRNDCRDNSHCGLDRDTRSDRRSTRMTALLVLLLSK